MTTSTTPTPERARFLRLRIKTRRKMIEETGKSPTLTALDERMKADAQAAHQARLAEAGV